MLACPPTMLNKDSQDWERGLSCTLETSRLTGEDLLF
jgi:hypothetical protein